jgi:hypothetical protein
MYYRKIVRQVGYLPEPLTNFGVYTVRPARTLNERIRFVVSYLAETTMGQLHIFRRSLIKEISGPSIMQR